MAERRSGSTAPNLPGDTIGRLAPERLSPAGDPDEPLERHGPKPLSALVAETEPDAGPMHGDPRFPEHRLLSRPGLGLEQDERVLLLAELRPFHGLFPDGPTKTYPRIFSFFVVRFPGSRSSDDRIGRRSESVISRLPVGLTGIGSSTNALRRRHPRPSPPWRHSLRAGGYLYALR